MNACVFILLFVLLGLAVVVLGLGEIFFFMGFGLPGILSLLGFIGGSIYLIYLGNYAVLSIFILVIVVSMILGFWFLSRKNFMKRISLERQIIEITKSLPSKAKIGAKGMTCSRLALSGKVKIDGEMIEAESEDGFLLEELPVYISRIEGHKVFVRLDKRSCEVFPEEKMNQ